MVPSLSLGLRVTRARVPFTSIGHKAARAGRNQTSLTVFACATGGGSAARRKPHWQMRAAPGRLAMGSLAVRRA